MRSVSLPFRRIVLLLGMVAAASVAHADEKADALLRAVERATRA
jgi:hypothetical protein